MLDFGALPPEVNSARMYAGAGSGPMIAAASAWDTLAGQLDLFAAGYSTVIAGLHGEDWSGAASDAMATAAAPYVAWLTTAAAQAAQAASGARAAAAGYEAAFAATVPPVAVAANRLQLATLVATNFFGQNIPAIAATEAAYAEMWAQDATAMYGYAASSSAASTLTPFSEPPQTTNAAAQSRQAAAVAQAAGNLTTGHVQGTLSGLLSTLPQQLQTLSTAGSSGGSTSSWSSMLSGFSDFNTLAGPVTPLWQTAYSVFQAGNFGTGLRLAELQTVKSAAASLTAPEVTVGIAAPVTGGGHGEVLGSVNSADQLGRLSVPQSWTLAATPESPASASLRSAGTGFQALPAWAANPPASASGGTPPAGIGPMPNALGRRGGNTIFRMRNRRFQMPRPVFGG
jgi:PPE-repeat protein